jgi:chemotaxis protein CheD
MAIAFPMINLVQGEYTVSRNPETVISAVLGSCVAACLYDPVTHIGGMNHFLLPGATINTHDLDADHEGKHLMELLFFELLKAGAVRKNLRAKLFGGSDIVRSLGNIGTCNAMFAQEFLVKFGISFVGGSLGGDCVRRLQFWPFFGKAKQMLVPTQETRPGVSEHSIEFEVF